MLPLPYVGNSNFPQAWVSLALVLCFYTITTIVFRMGLRPRANVVLYEPPKGISPSVASFLLENGQSERAFAVALISLAGKGIIRIGQKKDQFLLNRLNEVDDSLPSEEAVVLSGLFPSGASDSYAFGLKDYERLSSAFRAFGQDIETTAIPELISPHATFWIAGLAGTAALVLREVVSGPILQRELSPQALIYPALIMILGGYCLVAAVRVWPVTFGKLASYLPRVDRPRRPLNYNDIIPIAMTTSAFLGFVVLTALTSLDFSLLIAAATLLTSVFHRLLKAPTSVGRNTLAGLNGFKEFLSRADADRLNRENQPGISPKTLEEYSAYAVALRVEKSWGEEFTCELLELLQMDRSFPRMPDTGLSDSGPIQLNIKTPKGKPDALLHKHGDGESSSK